jgi:arylsulfatase A-like enzyme
MSARPNILLLLNDHQAYYRHGWDGGPRPQRPHFDRLAAGGVSFSRAYTACPLCMPARRTILTGVFPHRHRLLNNDEPQVPAPYELYFRRLAEQGYQNYYYGKWHAGRPGSAYEHGCAGFSYPSFANPYNTPEYEAYIAERGLPTAEHLVEHNFWIHMKHLAHVRPGTRRRGAAGWFDGYGLTLTPKETHEAFFLAHLACERLRELARRDQPFALRVDFWGPHHPHFPTQEFADLYDPAEIPVYGSFHDDLKNKPDNYHFESRHPLGRESRIIQPSAWSWAQWQKLIARCYAHITMIDAAGGLILDTLDELGLTQSTFVVWTADHGDALACHGGHFDKGSYLPEEVLRIPMAIRSPGHIEPGGTSDRLVSLIDLGPTFLNLAGTRFEHETDGTSLLGLCTGAAGEWREDLMCETHGVDDDVVIGRSLITDRYKYSAYAGLMHEMYDLRDDPYELNNLIDDPACGDLRAEMRRRLLAWQQRTRDDQSSGLI